MTLTPGRSLTAIRLTFCCCQLIKGGYGMYAVYLLEMFEKPCTTLALSYLLSGQARIYIDLPAH